MQISYIVSLMFFAAFIIYFSFAAYVVLQNQFSVLHHTFALLCGALAVWSFCYSVANCAPDHEICFLWRRMAVFGWGVAYSFLLHFVFALMGKKELLKKAWIYVLLYGPCLVNIYANFLNGAIAAGQYELVKTQMGWTNVSGKTPWDVFFYCYYVAFTLGSVTHLWVWAKRSGETLKQRQARAIIASYLAALVIGSLADIILNSFLQYPLPQISPLVILIPVSVMFYCVLKYQLLPCEKQGQIPAAGMILSEETRQKLYHYLSCTYILGTFISFALHYFYLKQDPVRAYLLGLPVFFVGVVLYVVELLKISQEQKDWIRNALIIVSIPMMNLLYPGDAAAFGWIFPVFVLFVAIVANTRWFLAAAGVSIGVTLIATWIFEPSVVVWTDFGDHSVRLLVIGILICFAHFIKKAYLQRLVQYEEQVERTIRAEKELRHIAYYDSLTNLPNRRQFETLLQERIEEAEQTGALLTVVYLDLDFFKTVNDLMGHNNGDELLRQFGRRLQDHLWEGAVLARFSGDEFLMLLPGFADISEISPVADRIRKALQDPIRVNDQELYVTASMGIAVFPYDGTAAEDLIKNADLALYTSKETGRSKYTFCSANIKKEFAKKNELTNDLYHAVEREELVLYYQPKVSPKSGEILGVEALLRWQHPEKGLVFPDIIIPLAEKIGVIHNIDKWVLRTACRQSKAWQKKGFPPVKMAVNFSLSNFYNENIHETVREILWETGADPRLIEIEITESIASYRPEVVREVLAGLKRLGVSVSIDDFGTEYSSLIRLQNLPIDRIKIDRQFVRGISNKKGEGILQAIFGLGHALNLRVTVEGVETLEQLEFVRRLSCDEIQGYYFYKPMSETEMETLLEHKEKVRVTAHGKERTKKVYLSPEIV